jgi:hypothetical protein
MKIIAAAFSLTVLALVATGTGTRAQPLPDSGSWSIQSAKTSEIHFDLRIDTPTGTDEWGNDVPLDRFQRLSRADLASPGATVRFDVVRDAGTLECTGHAAYGTGGGTFRYVANPGYAAKLAELGVSAPTADEQRRMALADIPLSLVRTLHDNQYAIRAPLELIRLSEHGVTAQFVNGLTTLGVHSSSSEELIRLVDHGVTLDYVRALRALGYRISAAELVRLVDHGVTADFIGGIATRGYRPSTEQLVDMVDRGMSREDVKSGAAGSK